MQPIGGGKAFCLDPAMRRILFWAAALLAGSFLAAAAVLLTAGPERLWETFGPADLGDVDFATLQRRDTPNEALACLPEFCAAEADMPALITAKPSGDLFLSIQQALAQEPGVAQVDADAGQGTLRYVQRSRLLGFPDTINVKVVPALDGGSAVLLYSRSQIGRGDMGVNRARLERWIELIRARAETP